MNTKQKAETTMSDPFTNPAEPTGGDRLPLADVLGDLLLITVHEVVHDIETEYGKSNAVRVDVAVLDGELKATTYADTLIFPRVLQGQLSAKVGGMVLGRLEQGEKKPGKNPPWRLADPTDDDKETARKYRAHTAKVSDPF